MKKPTNKAAGPNAPLNDRDDPLARGNRGKAPREELRQKTPRVTAPRQSRRPVERGSQRRSHT